ncbi:pH-response regulator protein palA/RIM20 [Neolecta irregularis DAH-3]|uniref:pH-response regulator protein palA/RIM20 n=1 Tax=Neolecta irregularis (strain DAH-3) TaxID=1198029 RepID=A0A1U7LML7_NEOID|nr:pH-response regulator protein palA/RIM20 [Neolecta irregularis DAH-3]|eukprot:OLL23761.1 pH-response regulator protein palA/RIM20 [Neolecta irregularis DAH-3]
MHIENLTMLENCMLAQAGENSLKDITIARLSIGVSEFYNVAYTHALKSQNIIHHLHLKSQHFHSASQFRLSQNHLANSQYGDEVARLRDALNSATKALQVARACQNAVIEDLQGLQWTVKKTLERAERDNDLIYLCILLLYSRLTNQGSVPNIRDLTPVKGAVTVKSVVPPALENPTTQYLFGRLVPWNIVKAVQIYNDRRENVVARDIISSWESLFLVANKKLDELNLPGSIQALELPVGLPPLLISRAAQVQEIGGVDKLDEAVQSIDRLRTEDIEIWNEAMMILADEKTENINLEKQYGTDRWKRANNEELTRLVAKSTEYKKMLEDAGDSDELVRSRLAEWEDLIALLGGELSDLEAFVPNSKKSKLSYQTEKAVRRVRDVMNELSRLEAKRRRDIENVKRRMDGDNIMPEILLQSKELQRQNPGEVIDTAHFEDLITLHLNRYQPLYKEIKQDTQTQESILQKITDANNEFLESRQSDPQEKNRQDTLQKLETAFLKFKELLSNFSQGLVFYSNFAKPLISFRDEVRRIVNQRHYEALKLIQKIQGSVIDDDDDDEQPKEEYDTDRQNSRNTKPFGNCVGNDTWNPSAPIKFRRSSGGGVFDPDKHKIRFG